MYTPAQHDELTTLTNYLAQQLDAIRASAYGLTEEQARATPCRSALSIGGIVKHVAYGLRGATARLSADPMVARELDPAAFASHAASFALTEDETAAGTLAEFDAARAAFEAAVAAIDPNAEAVETAAPWYGIFDARPIRQRYYLVHLVEEYARHAGHADIIREQLDGQAVPSLLMSLEGVPANDFFTPYAPAPGTLGAGEPSA